MRRGNSGNPKSTICPFHQLLMEGTIITHKPVKGVKLVAWGYIFTILLKKSIFSDPHQLYTTVLHVCRRYLCLANWGHLIHPDHGHHSSSSTMWPEQQAPTNHQGISDLAIVPTNNCNLHNMWRYSLKPMFVPNSLFIWRFACCRWDLCTNFGELWCRNKY